MEYTRPLPPPDRSARRRKQLFPSIWMSFDVWPSPFPSSGSLLVTDSKFTTGFVSQSSVAVTVAQTSHILWFGGQSESRSSTTSTVGGAKSTHAAAVHSSTWNWILDQMAVRDLPVLARGWKYPPTRPSLSMPQSPCTHSASFCSPKGRTGLS